MSYSKNLLNESKDPLSGILNKTSGRVGWSVPSNIAIIKYWGKKAIQIPMNPSLSLTLDKARTKTTVDYEIDLSLRECGINFFFENKKSPPFEERIRKFIGSLTAYLPYLNKVNLTIHSENSFPHSSGIASSASAMAALAMCLCEIESEIKEQSPNDPNDSDELLKKASFIARLGSGSASRSIYGKMVLWGETPEWEDSSNEYAIPLENIHKTFNGIRDSILIVESGKKSVSSSAGHALMENNPFAEERFRQADRNLVRLKKILADGDWPGFIEIMENEALSLHAMMMTSTPGYLLMQPATLELIKRVRAYREASGAHVGFTLDAGANVHILYSAGDSQAVERFIEYDLARFCENKLYIQDGMGAGPKKL